MDQKLIGIGVGSADTVLNSGSIVVGVFVILVIILILSMIAMYRFFITQMEYLRSQIREKDEEIIRLNGVLVDIQGKTISAIRDWKAQIEVFIKAAYGNNR